MSVGSDAHFEQTLKQLVFLTPVDSQLNDFLNEIRQIACFELSIVERIQRYNAGREPERLARKYEAMGQSAFGFLRGTSHLFHEDWNGGAVLDRTPAAWITGDLHLENFGSFKGDNRLAYFDLNDFDEATLAPCARDLARMLTSALVAARSLKLKEREGRRLASQLDRG